MKAEHYRSILIALVFLAIGIVIGNIMPNYLAVDDTPELTREDDIEEPSGPVDTGDFLDPNAAFTTQVEEPEVETQGRSVPVQPKQETGNLDTGPYLDPDDRTWQYDDSEPIDTGPPLDPPP